MNDENATHYATVGALSAWIAKLQWSLKLQLVSDVNIAPLAGHLANLNSACTVEVALYGQVYPTLQQTPPDLWGARRLDVA